MAPTKPEYGPLEAVYQRLTCAAASGGRWRRGEEGIASSGFPSSERRPFVPSGRRKRRQVAVWRGRNCLLRFPVFGTAPVRSGVPPQAAAGDVMDGKSVRRKFKKGGHAYSPRMNAALFSGFPCFDGPHFK